MVIKISSGYGHKPQWQVYVSDQGKIGFRFLSTGEFLLNWGCTGSGDGEFSWPQSLSLDNEGNVYVSDRGNHRVQVFDPRVGSFYSGGVRQREESSANLKV
ncbi:MAG: hypothetical protein Ct9H300mP11_12430 [Chloroflexota bacterium]|nr:MAG: hypothetical protein Ct9H300mP11_12430 [Chloroflexota bacterium]